MKALNAIADILVIEPPWNRPIRRGNPHVLMKAWIIPEAVQLGGEGRGDGNVAVGRAESF
jgi:hypothetical protein